MAAALCNSRRPRLSVERQRVGGLRVLLVATCVDRPHSVDKRKENRPAHLAGVFVSVSFKSWRYAIGQGFA